MLHEERWRILISDNGPLTLKFSIISSGCKEEADKLFEDVLHRKDRADGTRNAINVLKRFHFLFYLPVHTERNIHKGDYDVVINDYARAKSLFGDTQIQVQYFFFFNVILLNFFYFFYKII